MDSEFKRRMARIRANAATEIRKLARLDDFYLCKLPEVDDVAKRYEISDLDIRGMLSVAQAENNVIVGMFHRVVMVGKDLDDRRLRITASARGSTIEVVDLELLEEDE